MNSIVKINDKQFDIAELDAIACKLIRKNLSADEFLLEVSASSPARNWAYGETIEFWQNGKRRFRGKISENKKQHSSATEHFCITAKNALHELGQIIFQQPAMVYVNGLLTTKFRSKVILGMDEFGNKLNTATQAEKILTYAIGKNADIQVGEIAIQNEMLFDECVDLTCAEALFKILKWAPDCFVYFDYNKEDKPTINITTRNKLSEKQIDVEAGNIAEYTANRRDDLSVNSVLIKYERENTRDNFSYLELIEDAYPPNTETGGAKSIVMNVELSGSKATCQKYKIKTESIQENSKQWWKNHIHFLNKLSDFEILTTSRNSKLSNELIEGTIVDDLNIDTEKDVVQATISYTDEYGSNLTQKIAIKLIATSAKTATFTLWRTQEYAETAPIGLAKAIYNATSQLQYNGHIKIFDAKIEDFFAKRISILTDKKTIAENMPPYYAIEDIFKKTLLIKFGPPKHLYPDDIVELFRINRTRKASSLKLNMRTGEVSANTSISIGGKNPENATENNVVYSRLILQDLQASKKIDIDTSVLQENETATFSETYVYSNGNVARAKILMSEPIIDE